MLMNSESIGRSALQLQTAVMSLPYRLYCCDGVSQL